MVSETVFLFAAAALALSAGAVARRTVPVDRQRVFELRFPRTVTADQAVTAFRSLAGLLPPLWRRVLLGCPVVVLEAGATASGITHRLTADAGHAQYVVSQLTAALPGLRVAEVDPTPLPPLRVARALRLIGPGALRIDALASTATSVLASLQPLRRGQEVVVQYALSPVGIPLIDRVRQFFGVRSEETPELRRHPEPELAVALRVGIAARAGDAERLAARVLGGFHAAANREARLRRRLLPSAWVGLSVNRAAGPRGGFLLAADELAAIGPLPIGGPELPGLVLDGCRQLAPARDIPETGCVLGRSTFPSLERPVAVSYERGAIEHTLITGPTGSGKSELLASMAAQTVAAGYGALVIDPKIDFAEAVVERAPAGREVIFLDPSDSSRPLGFNLLAGGTEAAELVADGVVAIFRHLAAGSWGPRLEDTLRTALIVLARSGLTLVELPRLLLDTSWRAQLLGRMDDPLGVEPFFAWYDQLSDAEASQVVGPILNKVRPWTVRRTIRNVIGQRDSAFSLDEVLASGKLLVVSLPKGVLGDDAARLLGGAVIAALWRAVLARAVLPASQRRPFFVFVDEFQDFIALQTSFEAALAQSRGMGVGWVCAHQSTSQLSGELREACMANARTKVTFGLGAADARVFAREYAPHLGPEDLQGLDRYEAVARVSTGSAVSRPVTICTLPAPPPTGYGPKARARSRRLYGRDADEVDAELRARLVSTRQQAPVGGRRRA